MRHRNWPVAGAACLLGAVTLVAGCQAPAQPTGPTEIVLRIPDYDAFVDAEGSILRRFDFPPEYVDRERGRIVTRPATSGQWFEPWRVDSRGAYQLFESSIHTMRRVISVQVEPLDAEAEQAMRGPLAVASAAEMQPVTTETAEEAPAARAMPPASAPVGDAVVVEGPTTAPAGRFRVAVRVDKSRYTAPERQVTTASGALGMYSTRMPTEEGLRGEQSRYVRWVPLGRDSLLEEFFLDQLAAVADAQETE